jgi:hypothetical protein
VVVNRSGVLDKFDLSADRIREEILLEAQQPGGLLFVAKRLLGFSRLSERVHGPPARFIERVISKPFGFGSFGDPRGQGKSTLAQSIPFWILLQPPVAGTPLRGLDSRLAYTAPRIDLARYHHLAKVRDIFDRCEIYRELTGDFIRPRKDMWGLKEGFMFEGADIKGGRNIIPLGMETTSTTLHPIILIVDDPVTEQNYRSQNEIAKILDWIDKSFNLVEPEQGARLVIGNIWAKGDVQDTIGPGAPEEYQHLRGAECWRRGLIACEVCINGRPDDEHPMHMDEAAEDAGLIAVMLDVKTGVTAEKEDETRAATLVDAHRTISSVSRLNAMAQYFNKPVALGSLQFDEQQIKPWDPHFSREGDFALSIPTELKRVVAAIAQGDSRFVNNGGHGGGVEVLPVSALDVYVLVDPAPSEEETKRHSRFAAAAVGVEKGGPRIFLLQEYAKNAPPQVNYDALLDMYLAWRLQFRKMGVESVGYQATIPRAVYDRARVRGIQTLRLESIEKIPRLRSEGAQEDRIRYTLSSMFESGVFYARRDHHIFRGEVQQFGIRGARHDLLDAISNGPLLWGPARTGDSSMAKRVARRGRERLRTVGVTGY